MKALIWTLVAVVVFVLVATLIRVKKYYDNVTFNFKFDGNIKDVLKLLLSSIGKEKANVPIQIIIDNSNNKGVTITDLFVGIEYNGEEILRTKPNTSISIPPNVIGYVHKEIVDLFINNSTGKLVDELIKNSSPEVDILIRGKIHGIQINPISYKFKYKITI